MVIFNHTLQEVENSFNSKRLFFDEGHTKSYAFRYQALKKLLSGIKKYKKEILEAMYADYKKPAMEAYVGDVGVVIADLKHTMKGLKSWMAPERVNTPITVQPGRSRIVYEPKGVVVIFAPWNYPFNLAITPLIGAIAAGNCVIIKPAHETPHTAIVIEKLIKEMYAPEYISVVMGDGKTMGEMLLSHFTFNHIFFTGSAATGRWIMEKAARTLTPVTLELGGKCPAIVDTSARIDIAINRISWAKYFNCGQTCLSPDYILVHASIKDKFLQGVVQKISQFYGSDPQKSPDYGRIVNRERTSKILSYLEQGKIYHGGSSDMEDSYIEPTVILVDDLDKPIMKEEIFGPLMVVIAWKNKEDLVKIIRMNRYPLACYIFAEDSRLIDYLVEKIEFGGGCINNALAHYGNSHLPFGGVMNSGFGRYHGKYSFEAFSNAKPILNSMSVADLHIWYPPYTDTKFSLVDKIVG
ncbi:MAG: aldehyde dehydrogenase family protein [Saprospiraceae bacterium]|nr:aldehyde dehydrogenase family protein [Saprospiraceae bacterium]